MLLLFPLTRGQKVARKGDRVVNLELPTTPIASYRDVNGHIGLKHNSRLKVRNEERSPWCDDEVDSHGAVFPGSMDPEDEFSCILSKAGGSNEVG